MQSLAERIERDGPVNELDAVGWAIRLAKRLEALHALGVFHGSVSASCIETDGAERASHGRLADVRTTTSNVAYQSPERVLGGDLSAADDTWAVAAVLYFLLTGTSPFAAGSDDETRQKTLAATPAPLAVFDVGDDDLQHVLDASFARDPSQRLTTVVTLRKRLEEWHPDPKVKQLEALEDDEEVSTSEDDERTMLRAAPVFPLRGAGLGPSGSSPRAPMTAPKPAGSAPKAAGSAPRAGESTPRAGDVALRPAPSAPRPMPASPLAPPVATSSSRGSGRGAIPQAANVASFDFADPPTPLVSTHNMPIHAAAPAPARIPLPAIADAVTAKEPETPVQAPPTALLQTPEPSPSVAARAGMLPDPTDDDEEVKTVMREFPSNITEAARAALLGISSNAPGAAFAPRAVAGGTASEYQAPRPAAGRPPLNQTAPMQPSPIANLPLAPGLGAVAPMNALFSPQGAPRPEPPHGGDTLEDDDASDLQATVMREMPALPPEVAQRLDAALGRSQAQRPVHGAPAAWSPPPSPGIGPPVGVRGTGSMNAVGGSHAPASGQTPSSAHGGPVSPHGSMPSNAPGSMTTGPMPSNAPSPPVGYGPHSGPFSPTPPSHPMPVATQAMNAWNSGNTAPIQPVPPLPGVNAPAHPGAPMPSGFGQQAGAFGDLNAPSRPGFPAPSASLQATPVPGQTAVLPPGAWMQPPQPPAASNLDNRIGSDPFGQRSRGVTIAAVFALLLAAGVTFAVVRYLL